MSDYFDHLQNMRAMLAHLQRQGERLQRSIDVKRLGEMEAEADVLAERMKLCNALHDEGVRLQLFVLTQLMVSCGQVLNSWRRDLLEEVEAIAKRAGVPLKPAYVVIEKRWDDPEFY